MLNYIEYLEISHKVAIGVVVALFLMQLIGEFLEFKGKVVPEFMKIRKFFARKKKERETILKMADIIQEQQKTLQEFQSHYSKDNIAKRDEWIKSVDKRLKENDDMIKAFSKKLDDNNETTLSILIDSKRDTIIRFAQTVIDDNSLVTREQFNRVFKLLREYEEIIEKNNLKNGEVGIAHRIITESYENHMRNHTFIEDIRGYDSTH